MKILLVEDDTFLIESLQLCIQHYYPMAEVAYTSQSEEVIELLKVNKFDMVLIDFGLLAVDGLSLLREIRRFSNVPVTIVSVGYEDTEEEEAKILGADDYLTKPFDFHVLTNRLRETAVAVTG